MKELPKRDFDLGDEGYFFFSNSFKIHKGTVIGFWINPSDGGEQYHYQLEHEVELKNGEKDVRWATVPAEDIFLEEQKAVDTFAPLKKVRMEEAIRNVKVNLAGRKVDRDQCLEDIEDLEGEEKRLLEEYEKDYGEYTEPQEEVEEDNKEEKQ